MVTRPCISLLDQPDQARAPDQRDQASTLDQPDQASAELRRDLLRSRQHVTSRKIK